MPHKFFYSLILGAKTRDCELRLNPYQLKLQLSQQRQEKIEKAMFVDNHTLHIDFPQYKDKIASLSSINDKFKRLVDDYNKLTKSIEGLESRNIPVDDGHFTLMKMERAHLKDKLFQQLHHN